MGQFGVQDVCTRFAFEFETNRPLSHRVDQALADLRQGTQGRDASYISRVTGLTQLEHFAAAAQALKTSLVESLAAAHVVSQMLGEEREAPNA